MLAAANAVTDADLVAGTTLRAPQVTTTANDASTFKPYDPNAILGPTTPSLPYIAPPPKQQCNAVAQILMVVVAIVVTVYTAGAAAGAWGAAGTAGTAGAAGAAVGTTTAMSTMAAGTAALSGGLGATGAIAAGVGSFVGSIASQAVGKALGVVDHFSLRSAVASGLSAGITAGIGTQLGPVSQLIDKSKWGKVAASAVLSNIGSYAANKIAGVEASFSWRSVAADAVTSVVAGKINKKLGTVFKPGDSNGIVRDTVGGIVGGVVSVHTHRAFGDERQIDYGRIATDAFGNALGNAAVRGIQNWQANRAAPQKRSVAQTVSNAQGEDPALTAFDAAAKARLRVAELDIEIAKLEGDEAGIKAAQAQMAQLSQQTAEARELMVFGSSAQGGILTAQQIAAREYATHSEYWGQVTKPDTGWSTEQARDWMDNESHPFHDTLPSHADQKLVESTGLDKASYYAGRLSMGVWNAVAEPVRMVGDLGKVVYSVAMSEATGRFHEVQLTSAMARAAAGGATTGELLHELNPVYGLLVAQHEIRGAIARDDWGSVTEMGGGLLAGIALTRRGGGTRTFGAVVDVAEETVALRRIADLNATPEAQALHARINARAMQATELSPQTTPLGHPSRPGGYLPHDVDSHGRLSPRVNRAPGYTNTAADNFVQSHHPIQDKWARLNVAGYDRNAAPGVLLESSSGAPHAKISAAQQAFRAQMNSQGLNPWGTTIRQEFQMSYKQMIDAGVPADVARKAVKDSYRYFDSLGAF